MRLVDADAINPMRCPQSIAEMKEWIDALPTIKAIPFKEIVEVVKTCVATEMVMQNVEPVRHGRWLEKKDFIYCSECGEGYDAIHKIDYRYCPNCGARMEK